MSNSVRILRGKVLDGTPWTVFNGDVVEALAEIDDSVVDCIVTSPPYYWQRDYEVDGQLGHESTIEGYVESAATGLLVGRYIDRIGEGESPDPFPYFTALGALGRHVAESSPERYQPSNVTWALIENRVDVRKKKERRAAQVELALSTIAQIGARTRRGGSVSCGDLGLHGEPCGRHG